MTWKGPALSRLALETGQGGGDCGFPFTVGQHYLVYGWDHGGTVVTDSCTRTASFPFALEDLLVLGKGQPLPPLVFTSPLPVRVLSTISGLSSVRLWNFFWAHLGYFWEGSFLGLGTIFLAHRWWRWWQSRR